MSSVCSACGLVAASSVYFIARLLACVHRLPVVVRCPPLASIIRVAPRVEKTPATRKIGITWEVGCRNNPYGEVASGPLAWALAISLASALQQQKARHEGGGLESQSRDKRPRESPGRRHCPAHTKGRRRQQNRPLHYVHISRSNRRNRARRELEVTKAMTAPRTYTGAGGAMAVCGGRGRGRAGGEPGGGRRRLARNDFRGGVVGAAARRRQEVAIAHHVLGKTEGGGPEESPRAEP